MRSLTTLMFATRIQLFRAVDPIRKASLTFFTKETCQLCKNAHNVLDKTLGREQFRSIPLTVIDIMKSENSDAFDKYCYDVPVLHIDRPGQRRPTKFMHYFDEDELVEELSKQESGQSIRAQL